MMKPVNKRNTAANPKQIENISLQRLLPYWPLFSLLLVAALFGSWLFLQIQTPMYEASARILIKDEKKGAENSKTVEGLDALQSKKIVENEIDVITSKPIIYEVIKKLHLYAPIYKKTTFRSQLVYANTPVTIEVQNPEELTTAVSIPLTYSAGKQLVKVDQQTYPLNAWQKTPYGVLKFLPNEKYKPGAAEDAFVFSLIDLRTLGGRMEMRLKAISTKKLSSVIEVTYRDAEPMRAEDFLNELMTEYTNSGKADKNTLAANTLTFIDERLKIVEKELNDIEEKKQLYTARKGAFNISRQGQLFLENVSSNDQKMSEINVKLAVLNEVDNYVSTKSNTGGVVPATLGISDPMLSQLVDKLYNTELEYESLKKTTAENNPILLSLTDRIEKIKPNIRELITNQRQSLQASRSNIAATNGGYAASLSAMPQTERELVDIDRQQNIKSGIYTYLLQKKEETALSLQVVLPDSRIINNAEAGYLPVSPDKKLIYVGSVMVALLAGIGLVIARENFGTKVMFRHEIENSTGLPVIGEISNGVTADPIVISDDTKTFIAEQFRRLRITLSYLDVNESHKKILVTSAISGEGKSFIASNLALTLALTGKKVVLVDFDLNNPSLNNKLNISQRRGVTDYLLQECTLKDIVLPTDLDPNLFLISTGHLPHNPTELLLNGKTEVLLNELEKLFDYIVIDTAPVIPVTDAYILSQYCDATLYIIRHKYTPKVFVERIDENNKMHKLHNVGIVFNSVSSRGMSSKNYGYGYGYGYTYENSRKGRRLGNSLS